jgi:hypothetical protein
MMYAGTKNQTLQDVAALQCFVEEAGLEDDLDPVAMDEAYVSDEEELLGPELHEEDLRQWESDWGASQHEGAQL